MLVVILSGAAKAAQPKDLLCGAYFTTPFCKITLAYSAASLVAMMT